MPFGFWVQDQVSSKTTYLSCDDETVASVKKACKLQFKYDGPLYDVYGKVELVEEKWSVVEKGCYCKKKQIPLLYGKMSYASSFSRVSRPSCSKRAIAIWVIASLVAVGGYVCTHWHHTMDFAADMPHIITVY